MDFPFAKFMNHLELFLSDPIVDSCANTGTFLHPHSGGFAMKLAVLMLCHKDPVQTNMLLDLLDHEDIEIFVHVDKKSDMKKEIKGGKNVHLLPDDQRVDIQWGKYSMVNATLNLMNEAADFGKFDQYVLLSGQDLPLVPAGEILKFLEENKGKNYVHLCESKHHLAGKNNSFDKRNEIVYPEWLIQRDFTHRLLQFLWVNISGGYNHTFQIFRRPQPEGIDFYFGSQWWCITSEFFDYILSYLKDHPEYEEFYRSSAVPDESFFQTLLMNSPCKDSQTNYLHYVDWSQGNSSPKLLNLEDVRTARNQGKLFARKFDRQADAQTFDTMYQNLKQKN